MSGAPDRLSIDPKSPHYDRAFIDRGVGVRFRGRDRTNVAEYCVSEGWVKLIPPRGTYRATVKAMGPVEAWLKS